MKAETLVELAQNSAYSFVLRLVPRLSNVLFFIVVGWLAGPSAAGIFSLATTYLLILTASMSGLDDLVTRQVSREPNKGLSLLINVIVLRLGLSFLLYALLTCVMLFVFHYPKNTAMPILILGLSLIPDNVICVARAVLTAQRRFRLPAMVFTMISLFRLLGGLLIIAIGGSLQHIAGVWCIGSLMGMIVLLRKMLAGTNVSSLRAAWSRHRFFTHNWPSTLAFISISALMTFEGQADVLLLSAFHDEQEIGWYGAAKTVALGLGLLSQVYQLAVYPLIARYAHKQREELIGLYDSSIIYLGSIAFPLVSGVLLLAPWIICLIFGTEFSPAVSVLRLLIPSLLFTFLAMPDSRVLLAYDVQGWVVRWVLVSVGVNIALNLVLDPRWSAMGAAVARLASSAILFAGLHWRTSRLLDRGRTRTLPLLLYRSILATLIMTGVVGLVQSWSPLLSIGVGAFTYLITLKCLGSKIPGDLMMLGHEVLQCLFPKVD